MTDTQTTELKPWDDGDKAALLDWWKYWQSLDKKPESVNLTSVHYERILEGAIYEITKQS